MQKVKSSNMHAVGYDPSTRRLSIQFRENEAPYHYSDVPEEEHTKLMAADSIGKHFHAHIKGNYKHERDEK